MLAHVLDAPIDPIEGGSANDYDYVNGDPVNSFDVAGTCQTHHKKGLWGHIRSIRCRSAHGIHHTGHTLGRGARATRSFAGNCLSGGRRLGVLGLGVAGFSGSFSEFSHGYVLATRGSAAAAEEIAENVGLRAAATASGAFTGVAIVAFVGASCYVGNSA